MNTLQAVKLMKSGRFFSAEFKKKDGSIRKIHARSGVSKYVNGVGLKWSPEDKGYITVYDLKKKSYRMINTKTLIKVNNKEVTQ